LPVAREVDGVRAGAALSSPDGMIAGAEGSAIDALRASQAEEQCLSTWAYPRPRPLIPLCADREEQRPQQAAFAIP